MKRVGKTLKRFWPLYLMFLPGAVYLFINCYIPMFGIQIAFRTYNARDGIYGSPWCGLENFEFLFRTNDAWIMTRNTLLYNFVFIVLGTVLAIAVAIILNEVKSKGAKQLYQTVILIPYLISMVIVSYLAFAFLSTSNGFINHGILEPLFGENAAIDWYNEPKYWPVILVIINIWKGLGYNMTIFLAGLQGVPGELYEAATIDGATRLQRIIHINLPAIMPTIVIMLIMAVGGIMNLSFEKVLLMQTDSNTAVSEVISTYVYKLGIQRAQYSLSAAVGLFNNIINLILLVTVNKVSRKISETSLW